jgi:hypothetical protein
MAAMGKVLPVDEDDLTEMVDRIGVMEGDLGWTLENSNGRPVPDRRVQEERLENLARALDDLLTISEASEIEELNRQLST